MPGMPGRLPYRGEPPAQYQRRAKQARNLKLEERKRHIIIFVLLIISLAIFLIFIKNYQTSHNPNSLGFGITTLLVLLTLVAAANNGLKSVNRFRRNHDIDISDRVENDRATNTDNSNNLDS